MIANSLLKSRFIARYGPGRAGLVCKVGDAVNPGHNLRLWCDTDGTKRPINSDDVVTLTTTATLVPAQSGSKIMLNSATAFTTTLPAPSKGLDFRFFVQLAAGATGHTIAITGAGVFMYGKLSSGGAASAGTAGKGRVNTQATSTVGDALHVWSDGTNWFSIPTGTWAEQP